MDRHMAAARDLGFLVNKLARAIRGALADEIAPTGLTPAQAAVVLALCGAGPSTPAHLADALGFDRATMSGVVDRLRRDGWIDVGPHPADGRSRLLSATASSRAVRGLLEAASVRVADTALRGFDPGEAGLFVSMLGLSAENLEAATSGAGADPEAASSVREGASR